MICSAKAVGNYFLQEHPKEISHLKLQKLVYISHGWHLGIFDKELVTDEFAEAWKYGPVFPSLYHEFKAFGSKPITRLAKDLDEEEFRVFTPRISQTDSQRIELLCKVWDGYGNLTAGQLSELTHQEETPWSEVWKKSPGIRNLHIENEIIKDHYKKKLQDIKKQEVTKK